MCFAIVATGPAYGVRQASSVLQFAQALIAEGHELSSVFFCWEGVYDANQLTSSASDGFNPACGWQQSNAQHGVALNIYVVAALCRGIVDKTGVGRLGLASPNLQPEFILSGFGVLTEVPPICNRMVRLRRNELRLFFLLHLMAQLQAGKVWMLY